MARRFMGVMMTLMLTLLAGSATLAQYGGGGYDYGPRVGKGVADQLQTARTHATFSARSEVMRDVLWHLGHVVNCLEGSRGKNYDAKNDNPCQGQGSGIIPDLESAARGTQTGAAKALDVAREANRIALEALKLTDLPRAKAGASKVADLLGDALRAVGQ